MKKILFITIIIFGSLSLFSQDDDIKLYDPKAKEILDDLSDKLKDKNARLYFLYSFYNAQDTTTNFEYYGYLFAKDQDKYKVMVPDIEVFSDGIKTYSYNKKSNEMNITFVDPANDLVYTPQKMVTVYQSGFKYAYMGEANFDAKIKQNGQISTKNKTCHVIDLYPEDPKNSPIALIRIWIDKATNELAIVKYQHSSGFEEIVEILSFELDITINDDIFKFDPTKYPSTIDIIDFTED